MVAAVPAKTAWNSQKTDRGSVSTGLGAANMNQPVVPIIRPVEPYMIAYPKA